MTAGPLTVEIVATFCVAAALLYRYGDWRNHHVFVTVSVLIAWYFSLIIVFVLPMDVSRVRTLVAEQWHGRSGCQRTASV